jgi:hypothetical protein
MLIDSAEVTEMSKRLMQKPTTMNRELIAFAYGTLWCRVIISDGDSRSM